MSANRDKFPSWFLWIWERGFAVIAVIGFVALAIVLLVTFYVDRRLDSFEDQLTRSAPGRHSPPDLEELAAEGISDDAVHTKRLVYVPIYSHVYANGGRPFLLEATLSIRNTDIDDPLFIRSVAYYDTNGKLVRNSVDRLIKLNPLQTIEVLVENKDATGGSGANFIVEWLSTKPINEPMIEAVLVGSAGAQGISFRTTGRVLESETPPAQED